MTPYMTTEKTMCLTMHTFVSKVISLLFNTLPRHKDCCCLVTQSCPAICDPMDCSMPGFPVLHHLPQFARTQVHCVCNAIQPSHPLVLPSSPALNLSQHQGLFQGVGSLWWLKYWSFSFSINPSNEYSGLISFRIDWFDLLAVQGTLKSLLLQHN